MNFSFSCLNENLSLKLVIIFATPSTEEEWKKVAQMFEDRWNYPNCIGAMDDKHILIKQSKHSGSYYFNYKGMFSIVLLAIGDADYKFLYIDVECNGRISGGGVYRKGSLYDAIQIIF